MYVLRNMTLIGHEIKGSASKFKPSTLLIMGGTYFNLGQHVMSLYPDQIGMARQITSSFFEILLFLKLRHAKFVSIDSKLPKKESEKC